MLCIAREEPDLEAICWGFQILSVPLFQSIRPEREWQSTSFSSGSVVLGFPQIFTPAWAENQFPTISHSWLNLYADISELISIPCPIIIPPLPSFWMWLDQAPTQVRFLLVLVATFWTQLGPNPWPNYALKREEFLQRIGLGLFLINILVILIIKWKPTREAASWKEVASLLKDRVVTQSSLIRWRNKLKLGK